MDPRLNVTVDREVDYYDKQSRQLTTLIEVLGSIVGLVMGIGAVFGALNTMYSAVAERAREIATLRALGFGVSSVVTSFLFEAICIALAGGALGCVGVLPLNGLTTGGHELANGFRTWRLLSALRRRCSAPGWPSRCSWDWPGAFRPPFGPHAPKWWWLCASSS